MESRSDAKASMYVLVCEVRGFGQLWRFRGVSV
jgi:hypothetical protein